MTLRRLKAQRAMGCFITLHRNEACNDWKRSGVIHHPVVFNSRERMMGRVEVRCGV
jgi:hypothetical protein